MEKWIHTGYTAGNAYDNTVNTNASSSEKTENNSFSDMLSEKSLFPKGFDFIGIQTLFPRKNE